ncbi:presequence translocated-associated motor subunit PAM17- mitochondrial [Apiospora arundinis]|uniref:Presequence translocated-associated motor subunit PAM17 n=1 Tax=Apiospora arundinis TaxID=335852 RepID=A0ABR2JA57_9PEZI
MLATNAHIMRFGGALGRRSLQLPAASGVTKAAPLTTPSCFPPRHFTTTTTTTTLARHVRPDTCIPRSLQCQFVARRAASTTTTAGPAGPAASARDLNWDTFFKLRKTRRRYQLACSLVTMFVGGSMASMVLVNLEMDWMGSIPLDPFITLGLMTMGSAALGWLAGPSLGSAIFYTLKRGVKQPMAIKEAEFFARIKKNRVDPSVSSVGNPVPDYYGEKISSVAGYRQWMKDQRAFNKKRTSFV